MFQDKSAARVRYAAGRLAVALLAGAVIAPAASASSTARYRISVAGSYDGQGPTKISCLRDVTLPDGSSQQQSYTVNGSASEHVSVHTIKPATADTFFGGGGSGRQLQADTHTAGRVAVTVRRANIAPTAPCLRDPRGPPSTAAGCGTRSMTLRADPLIDARGNGPAAKVPVALDLLNARTLLEADDPFLASPHSGGFPQCLMPDGQVFVTSTSSNEFYFAAGNAPGPCGTLKATKDPTAHRFFSGSKRIVLSRTVRGHGFMTNDLGESLGTSCDTSSTYTLNMKLTFVRTFLR